MGVHVLICVCVCGMDFVNEDSIFACVDASVCMCV